MKVDFENYGEIVSLSDFAIVAWTHSRVPYSSPVLMVAHFESVRLKKMSRTLENLVEMMSPTYFEIIAHFHKRLPNAFLAQILLQLDVLEKKHMEFDLGRIANCTNFEFVVGTQAWLLYSFSNWIFLRLVEQRKEDMKQNQGMNIVKVVDKMVENLTRGR